MKIIGWNINHRYGYRNTNMPTWIKTVIQEKTADIIILTETSFMVPNWEKEYRNMFNRNDYYVFCSNNTDVGNNEVTIAVKKDHFKIVYVKSFLSENHTYPDHLEINCIHKDTGKKLVIIGMRIHATKINNQQKKEEFNSVLKSVEHDENVLIVGDFNNYRRGYDDEDWCLTKVQQLAKVYGFEMHTPKGGSIYQDNDGDFSFPEDHIFTRGQAIKLLKLYDYDRAFVNRQKDVYIWGTDFQKYIGKDRNGKSMYDSIKDPFPDHAIIEADFEIE